jgi:Arc/MetJ family transcription regulator
MYDLTAYVLCVNYTYNLHTRQLTMRTNIVIDDELMSDALKVTGVKTKKEAVELGLKMLIQLKKQAEVKEWRGKLTWEGDLASMRQTR